jgi:protein with PEP-CTERM/exosortase system signal
MPGIQHPAMKSNARVALLVCAGLLAISARAQTLSPSQETNANPFGIGLDPFLTVNFGDDVPNIGLLQFDVSSITGTISSAELNLFQVYNDGYGADFGLFVNTSPWTPGSVAGSLANAPTVGAEVGSFDITDNNSSVWRSVDITAVTQDWINGSLPNYGLTLERLDQANPYVYFGSQDNSDFGVFGPTLVITAGTSTQNVPDSGTTLTLLGGAVAGLAALRRRFAR